MTIGEMKSHIEMNLMRLSGGGNKGTNGIQHFMGGEVYKYINEAYRMFLDRTNILQARGSVTITSGYGTLPSDCIKVLRVEDSDGKPVTGRIQKRFTETEDLPK